MNLKEIKLQLLQFHQAHTSVGEKHLPIKSDSFVHHIKLKKKCISFTIVNPFPTLSIIQISSFIKY